MPAQKPYTSYNPYFLLPFLVWIIAGGTAIALYDKHVLFAKFNGHHTKVADVLMYNITLLGEGVFSTIVLLTLIAIKKFKNWWYVVAALASNILPAILIQAVKRTVDAPRPLKYFNEAPWIHTLPEWPRLMEHSFPSGHTCAAFCLFGFLSMILSRKYKWAGAIFFCIALLIGYSRMYVAAHFFIDVYVGSLIGTTFTLLVMAIMNRYQHLFFKQ